MVKKTNLRADFSILKWRFAGKTRRVTKFKRRFMKSVPWIRLLKRQFRLFKAPFHSITTLFAVLNFGSRLVKECIIFIRF